MRKRKITISTLLIGLLMLSCGGGDSLNEDFSMYEEISSSEPAEVYKEDQVSYDTPIEIDRKLIKTGYIEFEVENFSDMNKLIDQAIDDNEAYLSSESEYYSYDRANIAVEIRVPAENFEKLLNQITIGIDDFDRRDINVSDVTEEFIDVEARLKAKKELEKQYIELLDKAKSVSEILEIEYQIGLLRADIESFEGRLRYLTNSVAYSTLSVTYWKPAPKQNKFGNEFKDGFGNGWNNLIWFFVGLTNIWPFLLLSVIAIIFLKKRMNKRKNEKK